MCHRLAASLPLAALKLVTVNKVAVRILTRGSGSLLLFPSLLLHLTVHRGLCAALLSRSRPRVWPGCCGFLGFFFPPCTADQRLSPLVHLLTHLARPSLSHWPRPESDAPLTSPRWPWNKEPEQSGHAALSRVLLTDT